MTNEMNVPRFAADQTTPGRIAEDSLRDYKERLHGLERNLKAVVTENNRLSSELADCQKRLLAATEELVRSQETSPGGEWDVARDSQLERLRSHVSVLEKERDDLIDLMSRRTEEVRRHPAGGGSDKFLPPQSSDAGGRNLSVLARGLKVELLRTREILARRDGQLSALSRSHAALGAQLAQLRHRDQVSRAALDESAGRERALASRLTAAESKSAEMAEASRSLQRDVRELRNREIELEGRLRDAIEVANTALREKDFAQESESNVRLKCEEIETMAKAYAEQTVSRAEERMEDVQARCRAAVEELRCQLRAVDQEREKLSRDYQELLLKKDAPPENPAHLRDLPQTYPSSVDALLVEREKEVLSDALRDTREKLRAEERRFARERDKLEQKLASAHKSLVEARNEAAAGHARAEALKADLRAAKSAVTEVDVRHRRNLDDLKRALTAKEDELEFVKKEHEVKVSATQTSSLQSVVELNKLLDEQQKISARWKQEAQHLARKSQERIGELKKEIKKLREDRTHLATKLQMLEFEMEVQKTHLFSSPVPSKSTKTFQEQLDEITCGLDV